MSVTKLAVATATFSLLIGSAIAAPNIVGAWKGKLTINFSKIPNANNPQVRPMIERQAAMISKMTMNLNLAKSGSFVLKVGGLPGAGGSKTQTGTWTLKQDQVTLISSEKKEPAKTFTLAKNGKAFSLDVQGGQATLSFSR
jgi:hypothetical protein